MVRGRVALAGLYLLSLADGCGARAVPHDETLARVRAYASAHLRCPEERLRVVSSPIAQRCAEREPSRRHLCRQWTDAPEPHEQGWIAEGCGLTEYYRGACEGDELMPADYAPEVRCRTF